MVKKKALSPVIPALSGIFFMLCAFSFTAAAQDDGGDDGKPDPIELAEKETERLASALKLEDWQVFYVDSTLRHDYVEWMAEMDQLKRSHVENSDLYVALQDKWMVQIENSYRKYFSEEQWKEYMLQGGERMKRDREKRAAKAEKARQMAIEKAAKDKEGKNSKKNRK